MKLWQEMKNREKNLEKRLREKVAAKGGAALKFYSSSFTGMPDRIVLLPGGKIFFAEVKSEGKKPTPQQRVVHRWLRKLGFAVFVIDSRETFDEFFKMIDDA